MRIVNLTQHASTPDQRKAGVYDLEGERLSSLKAALNFTHLPQAEEIRQRAEAIADLVCRDGDKPDAAMIGGAPFLMASLERALAERGIKPLYAFSLREVKEMPQPDGSVKKEAVFRHLGFVPAVEVEPENKPRPRM